MKKILRKIQNMVLIALAIISFIVVFILGVGAEPSIPASIGVLIAISYLYLFTRANEDILNRWL